jgi:hypothetical protein
MSPDQETVVPEYRKTKTAGVYVRHQARCPAAGGDPGPMPLPAHLPRSRVGFGQTGDGVVCDVPRPR